MNAAIRKENALLLVTGFVFAWAGIGIQLADMLQHRQQPVLQSLIKFFSYFTILTNLLVALYFTARLFFSNTRTGIFSTKYAAATALTVYILVVGLIYNLLLRQIWTFTGWGLISNELLHTVTPLYFLSYWIFVVKKYTLKYKTALYWTIYPLAYMAYSLTRGEIVNSYPYPFIDVNLLGYSKVFINSIGIAVLFLVLFYAFITIGNRLAQKQKI